MTATIVILDEADGFTIVVKQDNKKPEQFRFDQEDTREKLIDVFSLLGVEAEYEESY